MVTKMDEFCRACEEGNLLKVKSMVERGHDVNKKDKKDYGLYRTPLMYAAGEGRFDVVKYLIIHGADLNKTNDYEQTALHYASGYGHLNVVELLLSKGAGIDVEDEDGHTPLMLAAETKQSDSLWVVFGEVEDCMQSLHQNDDRFHQSTSVRFLR